VRAWSASLWSNAKNAVLAAAADPDSELRTRVAAMIHDLAGRLQTDPVLRELVQRQGRRAGGYLAERFAGDLAKLVSSTVARWDTDETSRRIELQVGRDLQFIRINGTIVGGLVGVLIHAVSVLL
jgi:uncharacterized membrane-anchored protein YjiN (DUF445 family)